MSAKPSPAVSARYRWEVAGRVLLATAGGYVLTALLSTALALILPWLPGLGLSRAEGVLIASLLSFTFYTLYVLWVFSTHSAWRVWGWSVAVGAGLYGVIFLAQ